MAKALQSSLEQYVIDIVKKKRIEKGWSQKELAYRLDMSIGFIGNVENPKLRHKYKLEHLNLLAKVFECSPQDFLPKDPL